MAIFTVFIAPLSEYRSGRHNFYQADGNPQYESTIFQTITGLTAGTTYTL